MKRKEFLEKWDKKILEHYNFVIGRKTNVPYSTGCYQDGEKWFIYKVGERQNLMVVEQGTEDEIITTLNEIVEAKREQEERRERAKR